MALIKGLRRTAESLGAPNRSVEAPTSTIVIEPLTRALPTSHEYDESLKKEKPKTKAEAIAELKKPLALGTPKPKTVKFEEPNQ